MKCSIINDEVKLNLGNEKKLMRYLESIIKRKLEIGLTFQ